MRLPPLQKKSNITYQLLIDDIIFQNTQNVTHFLCIVVGECPSEMWNVTYKLLAIGEDVSKLFLKKSRFSLTIY